MKPNWTGGFFGVFIAFIGSAAFSQSDSAAFEWLERPANLSSDVCKTIPLDEMGKYDACKFTFSLRVAQRVKRMPDIRLEIFDRSTAWDWLAARPLVDCDVIDAKETVKFGCSDGSEEAGILASTVLSELKDWRSTLSTRFQRASQQREALEQAAARIALPDQLVQLEELDQLELALARRQAKAALLSEVAKLIAAEQLVGVDLAMVEFGEVIEEAAFTSVSGRIRRTASRGDIVLILDARGATPPATLHVDHGLGTLPPGSLVKFDTSSREN